MGFQWLEQVSMEGSSRTFFLMGNLKPSSATTFISCQRWPPQFSWWNRPSYRFVSTQISEFGSGSSAGFHSLFYQPCPMRGKLLRGAIINHLEGMQEEMLESISPICKVTIYLKCELSQDPHKLCVSLSKLQAYGESCNASISSYWFYSELLPEVTLHPSTQLRE